MTIIYSAGDRSPYTYRIHHIPTNKSYYGVQWRQGCQPEDLWTKYFTSSTIVSKLISEFGKESFNFEIRKVFNTAESAINWEERVLRRLKVNTNPKWLNVCEPKGMWFIESPLKGGKWRSGRRSYPITNEIITLYVHKETELPKGWRRGKKESEEIKKMRSEHGKKYGKSRKGIKFTDEHIKNRTESRKRNGKWLSQESKRQISNSLKIRVNELDNVYLTPV